MQHRNTFPLVLLFGGLGCALYFAGLFITTEDEYAIEFALSAFIAVIGWLEIKAEIQHREQK